MPRMMRPSMSLRFLFFPEASNSASAYERVPGLPAPAPVPSTAYSFAVRWRRGDDGPPSVVVILALPLPWVTASIHLLAGHSGVIIGDGRVRDDDRRVRRVDEQPPPGTRVHDRGLARAIPLHEEAGAV